MYTTCSKGIGRSAATLRRGLLGALLAYLLTCTGIAMFQDHLLYYPDRATVAEMVAGGLAPWPSATDFRGLLAERGPGMALTESELEDLVERTFRRHGTEPPMRQREIGGTSAPIGRVDFYDPAARAVLEADGRKHHSELLDRERDAWRDLELAVAGFVVVRVTHRQLTREPTRFIARWRDLTARRAAS